MTIRDIFTKIAKENNWPDDKIAEAVALTGMEDRVDVEIEGRAGMTKAEMEEHLTSLMRKLYKAASALPPEEALARATANKIRATNMRN